MPVTDWSSKKRGNHADVKCNSNISGIFALHQTRDHNIHIVRCKIPVNTNLPGVRFEIIVGHPCRFFYFLSFDADNIESVTARCSGDLEIYSKTNSLE